MPAVNISKTMYWPYCNEILQDDGMPRPSMFYSSVVMTTNSDVILTSVVKKLPNLRTSKISFLGLFPAFFLTR